MATDLSPMERLAQLDDDELDALIDVAQQRAGGVSRRGVLKGLGMLGGGALFGGAATEAASAQASDSDGDPDVGTPSTPVDVFADGVSANSVSTEKLNSNIVNAAKYGNFSNAVSATPAGGVLWFPDGNYRTSEYGEAEINKPLILRGSSGWDVDTTSIVGSNIIQDTSTPAFTFGSGVSAKYGAVGLGWTLETDTPAISRTGGTQEPWAYFRDNFVDCTANASTWLDLEGDNFYVRLLNNDVRRTLGQGIVVDTPGGHIDAIGNSVKAAGSGTYIGSYLMILNASSRIRAIANTIEDGGSSLNGLAVGSYSSGTSNNKGSVVMGLGVESLNHGVTIGQTDGDYPTGISPFGIKVIGGIAKSCEDAFVRFDDALGCHAVGFTQLAEDTASGNIVRWTTNAVRSGASIYSRTVLNNSVSDAGAFEPYLYVPQLISDSIIADLPTSVSVGVAGAIDHNNAPAWFDDGQSSWVVGSGTTFTP